jgi:regulator of sigma E protease
MGILWVGLPRPNAVVGMVEANSPAALAGVRPGDRIVSLDGDEVEWWDEVVLPIEALSEGETLELTIERGGETERIDVPVGMQTARDRFGSVVDMGWVGIGHERLAAIVGVPDASSLATRLGLRSGDLIVSIDGREVEDWEALRTAQRAASESASARGDESVVWQIERETRSGEPVDTKGKPRDPPPPEEIRLSVPARSSLEELGLRPATLLVSYVSPDRPAALAGLQANDLVLSVDGDPIGSFTSFVSRVQTSQGRELAITYSRDGEVDTVRLRAQEETVAGPYAIEGMEEKVYQIGLGAALASLPGARSVQRVRNPIESLPRAVMISWQMTTEYLQGLGKFFTGEVGTDKLSGPIGIARIARKSLDRGWLDYLWMMMLISINLGILNLLPIPILDGGQAVIYAIEGIKRSPLSLRSREIASSVGFALLVLLMGRAFWNDLTPFWMKFVSWLSNGPQ